MALAADVCHYYPGAFGDFEHLWFYADYNAVIAFHDRIRDYEFRNHIHTAEVRRQIHLFMAGFAGDKTQLPDGSAYLYPFAVPDSIIEQNAYYPRHIIRDVQLAFELNFMSGAHAAEMDWDKLRRSGLWVYDGN